MKTSAELQQQSFFRKVAYFGLMIVLFTIMTFSGRLISLLTGKPNSWSVASQARALQFNESEQGEVDLAGSTIRLALSGTRGFAITFFWIATIEKQKRHEWNQVEFLVNTITKLQPHFLTPWLFQSWNLAYNVSVESDRVKDKYFYISRGIELLADGERINRSRGIDPDGTEYVLGNPDMRFWIGFYYSNKFGMSDEQNTLRSLLQLSCINPLQRDPNLLRPDKRRVDPQAFREFVRKNPMLCRRLRDYLRCSRPEDVVDFLADNANIPSRYEEFEGRWQLKRKLGAQFPVLPSGFRATEEIASPEREFDGNFDSYHCAWAWHLFAQQPLPPAEYGKPVGIVQNPNPLRYRIPRQPATIIFRQQPPRSMSYIAERLQKEGWFDETGWEVDEGHATEQWFPDESFVVGADLRYSSKSAWQAAYQAWEKHGLEHGHILSESRKRNLMQEGELYRSTFGVSVDGTGPELTRDQVTDELWRSYDAQRQLFDHQVNLQMTNFNHFLYRAQAESDDRTVRMRRLFFEASRLSSNPDLALQKYEQAFAILLGEGDGKIGLLEAYPNFRRDGATQEDLYEKNIEYLTLLEKWRSPIVRGLVATNNLVTSNFIFANPAKIYASMLYQMFSRPGELPSLFTGPLDGTDSRGDPWVSEGSMQAVNLRLGRVVPQRNPPPEVPTPNSADEFRP
jgi:hypothetical protein